MSLFVITIYQAFQYLKELYTRNILWTIEYKLRNKVSLYILKGTYQSVLKYRKSELISYFIGQASRGLLFYVLFQYGFTILQSIMLLIFLCAISLQLTLVVFGYVMVQFFIVHWKTRVIQKLGYDIANRSDTILHVFQQHIFGYKFISVLKGNHVAAKKVLEPLTEQFRARVNFERTRGRLESSQEWMHISLILGMLYGSYAVWGFELAKNIIFCLFNHD